MHQHNLALRRNFYLGSTVGTKMKDKFFCMGFCRDTIYNDESGRRYGFTARPVFK